MDKGNLYLLGFFVWLLLSTVLFYLSNVINMKSPHLSLLVIVLVIFGPLILLSVMMILSSPTPNPVEEEEEEDGIESVHAFEREQYRETQDRSGVLPFAPRALIARLAMTTLPPIKSFSEEDKADDDAHHCCICDEAFHVGELIQPFGLCSHQFHSSCLTSWLHAGNTTCPLCRVDLATSIHDIFA